MADNPEGLMPNRSEEDCSQLMGNVSQKQLARSSEPDSQHPDQFNLAGMKEEVPSVTLLADAFSGEHSSPVSEILSPLDIDCFIRSFDLKSEEITSLMAEKVPSSDSDDSYENEDPPEYFEEDVKKLASELPGKAKLDEDTMKSWLADGSDDSAMSSCRELLIPLDDESDMEEFNYNKENAKSDTNVNNEKEEPFVDDLISLKESGEKILEAAPNNTVVSSENNLHIDNKESVLDQTAIGNKSLLDIEIEKLQNLTAVVNNHILDTELETSQNQAAVENNSLLDTELETSQNQAAVENNSLLDTELETSQNQATLSNKSLLDIEVETSQNQAAVSNKSLLDTELETSQNQAAVSYKGLMEYELETLQNLSDVANKSTLNIEPEKTSPKGKQDSKSDTEKCARICIDHIKSVLTDALKEVKKSDPNPAAIKVDAANGNGKSLEEELRQKVESNSTQRNVPQWDAEMGLPKVNVPDSLRIMKDESLKRNIKKVGVYINKLKTSSDDISNDNNLKKEDDEVVQLDKTDEVSQETFPKKDSDESKDVFSTQEASPLNGIEENTLQNVTAAEIERQGLAETNIVNESLKERHSLEKTTDDTLSEMAEEKKVETNNVQETAVVKSILKKHVSFASTRGHPGMEHMALHHEETKIEEKQLDMETPLRFLTETYPSHEDEEMLSESATLEPCALSRTRRESPRAAELYEELKILEGEEQPKTISCSPYPSPDRPDFPDSGMKDNKTVTNKSGNKFSKFFKSFKKKIWN